MPFPSPRPEQPWPVRLAHWLNVPLLGVMALSGLQILAAFPDMGPVGQRYRWYPLQGWVAPGWLRAGGWLAGARALHFGLGLLFVANGLLYGAWLLGRGEWKRRLFLPKRDFVNARQTLAYYLRLRKSAPEQELYNGLQRAAYTAALGLGVLVLASGLVLYKPVQLSWLTWLLGGYDSARVVHFATLVGLALFTAGHVLLVALHPRAFVAMVTGGRRG